MHRSLTFAMQRVCFRTKRSFPATNRAAEFALNNFGMHVLAADEERECVGSPRGTVRCESPHGVVVREHAQNASGERAQPLSGCLTPFVVRPVRLHAKTPWLSECVFTLRPDHGTECAHCDYLIS